MMTFNSHFERLGFRRPKPVVGIHFSSACFTLVALRPNPVRVVAVGRHVTPDAAVVDGEIRQARPLAEYVRQILFDIRLGPGVPTVVAIEPVAEAVSLDEADAFREPECAVDAAEHDRVVEMAQRAQLELLRIDVVPFALARLARRLDRPFVALRAPGGWSVVVDRDSIRAERSNDESGLMILNVGPDLERTRPLLRLPGIQVPTSLEDAIDIGRDATAIGAALAGFDLAPLVVARPNDPRRPSADPTSDAFSEASSDLWPETDPGGLGEAPIGPFDGKATCARLELGALPPAPPAVRDLRRSWQPQPVEETRHD